MFGPPPPAPRFAPLGVATWNVRFSLSFFGGWAGIGFLVLVIFSVISRPIWDDWRLDRRGVRVDAQAVEVRTTSTSINDEDLMNLVLRFRDRREREHTAIIGTTNSAKIDIARAHGTLSIEYDPEDPSCARLEGESANALGLVGTLIPLGFVLTGAPFFLLALVRLQRARRIYRDGEAIQATVVQIVDTPSSENDETVKEMRYSFQTSRGPANGTWKMVNPPPAGAQVWIVYDPASPDNNVPSQS